MVKAIVIAIVLTIVIGAYACALGWLGIKSAEWEEAHPRPKKPSWWQRFFYVESVDEADRKDMYGNCVHPELHEDDEINRIIKDYTNS